MNQKTLFSSLIQLLCFQKPVPTGHATVKLEEIICSYISPSFTNCFLVFIRHLASYEATFVKKKN